jgi:sugar phosphate isomerase/epimerase
MYSQVDERVAATLGGEVHNMYSRRECFGLVAGACVASAAGKVKVPGMRIGVTDWNLKMRLDPEALRLAKELGFEGVEVGLGRGQDVVGGKMPLDKPELQGQYLAAARETGVEICSVCVQTLHANPLKTDPLGRKWVAEAIPIAERFGASSILLPIFGDGVPQGAAELDRFADILKEFVPAAEKAGVDLCLEDMVTAEDNVRMFDRIGSNNVKSFYDVSNVLRLNVDPVKEIRFLGKDRIGCVHLKDGRGYLGASGNLDFRAILEALAEIGYEGWADFETATVSGDVAADMRKNLTFIRSLLV